MRIDQRTIKRPNPEKSPEKDNIKNEGQSAKNSLKSGKTNEQKKDQNQIKARKKKKREQEKAKKRENNN